MLSRRITHEDVLSIVDSYFMPYGIESDQYAILGEILDCRLEQNNLTGENVWVLDICCNEMNLESALIRRIWLENHRLADVLRALCGCREV